MFFDDLKALRSLVCSIVKEFQMQKFKIENENATERHFYRVKSQNDEAEKMKLTELLE